MPMAVTFGSDILERLAILGIFVGVAAVAFRRPEDDAVEDDDMIPPDCTAVEGDAVIVDTLACALCRAA